VGDFESDEPLLSSGDVAKRLGVSRRTVSEWVRRGRLVPTWTTLGGRHRFRWSDVQVQIKAAEQRDD
jgi:excisionase family DNA binding protein